MVLPKKLDLDPLSIIYGIDNAVDRYYASVMQDKNF